MVDLLVHEWIEKIGGSEKVLERIAHSFPEADIATLWTNDAGRFAGRRVLESPLARTPLRRSKAAALPLMSRTWRSFDARRYDRAIISTHSLAHHMGAGARQDHLERFVYVHSPARWIWARDLDPRGNAMAARVTLPLLKRHDRRGIRAGSFAANSHYIAARVRKAWEVDAHVIYPPVDTSAIRAVPDWRDALTLEEQEHFAALPATFLLGASRFIDYKRLDRVMRFGERVGLPVVIAGSGPLAAQLHSMAEGASIPVVVTERPSDALLRALMQHAEAFIYPPIEDFGIMPVECYALGTPAIVNIEGGAGEAAMKTGGGVAVSFEHEGDWKAALDAATALPGTFAETADSMFSHEQFAAELMNWVGGTRS